jgi:hypothetical protein
MNRDDLEMSTYQTAMLEDCDNRLAQCDRWCCKGGYVKTKLALMAALAAIAVSAGGAAYAHHSLDGEFDQNKLTTIKGTISKVDWINPHVYFTIDVKDAKGKVTKWQAETVPVGMLRRGGITKTILQGNGQEVQVTGFLGRKTKNFMFGNELKYADGRVITFAGYKGE